VFNLNAISTCIIIAAPTVTARALLQRVLRTLFFIYTFLLEICDKSCDFCWEIKGKYGKSAFKNDAGFPKRKSVQSTQNQVISKAKAQVTEVFDSLS